MQLCSDGLLIYVCSVFFHIIIDQTEMGLSPVTTAVFLIASHHHHHQRPINVPTAGAQASYG
jgi:hypothetical protein